MKIGKPKARRRADGRRPKRRSLWVDALQAIGPMLLELIALGW
jgi:hypothetical protein